MSAATVEKIYKEIESLSIKDKNILFSLILDKKKSFDDIYSKEDEKAYQEALKEFENGDIISWDDLKKEINLV